MFSRSKHSKARHGSASSVDLTSTLNNRPTPNDSTLAPIPGSPVQATHAQTKSSGGRAFNFLVERARGGNSRARTTSDEGHSTKTKSTSDANHDNLPRPPTASGSGSSSGGGGGGGGLFGRKGSLTPTDASAASAAASSSKLSTPNSINLPVSSTEPSTQPPHKSSGGFFRRQVTQSNPPKPGWLSKAAAPQPAQGQTSSPLGTSPGSPTLIKTSELPMPGTSKRDEHSRKQSLPVSENGGLLASSRRAFSRSVEDLTARRSSKYSMQTVHSNDEEPPPLPTMSNSRSAADPLTTLADQAKSDRAVTTRRNRTTSLFPSSAGSLAIAQLAHPNPNSASPIIPGPVGHSPALDRGSPMGTSASVPNFRIGTFNHLETAGKRDSQTIVLSGFLQRKRDYMPVSPGGGSGASGKSPNSFSAPLHNGGASPVLDKDKAPAAAATSQGYFPSFRLKTPGSGSSRGEPDLSKNWKPFAAVLRGSKLYLHKVPSDIEKAAKSLFPTGVVFTADQSSSPSANTSPTVKHSPLPPSSPSPQTLRLLNEWTPSSKPYLVLSLSGVEVHQYDNSQRSFVFEIITEDGQRSLLQASSKDQLDSWTDNFHRAGTEIAHRRATLLAQTPLAEEPEPVVTETRQVATLAPSGPVNKGSTTLFGVSLWELVQREGTPLPKFVDTVLTLIEARGLSEVGIYRISGESKIIQSLKESLNKGADPDKLFEEVDVHNLTGVFKLWLREMPELIPFELYYSFISADAVNSYDERLYTIRDLAWQMPQPHFNLIKRLMEHLDRITDNEQVNAMHAQNLALVLAPTLLRPPPGPDSFGLAMINLGKAAKIVSSLILQSAWVFGEGQEEEQEQEQVQAQAQTGDSDPVEKEILDAANGTSLAPAVGLGLDTGALAPSIEVTKGDEGPEEDMTPLAEQALGVPPDQLIPALAAGEPAAVEQADAIARPATPPPDHDAAAPAPAPASPESASPTSDAFFDTTTSPVPASIRSPGGGDGQGSPTPGASRPLSMMALQLDGPKLPEQGLMSPMDEGVFAQFGVQEGSPGSGEVPKNEAEDKEGSNMMETGKSE